MFLSQYDYIIIHSISKLHQNSVFKHYTLTQSQKIDGAKQSRNVNIFRFSKGQQQNWMEQKLEQKTKMFQELGMRCQFFLKKSGFYSLKNHRKTNKALFKYVGKESEAKLGWLFSIDSFKCCEIGGKLTQDVQSKIKQGRLSYNPSENQSQAAKMKESLKKTIISFHTQALNMEKIKIEQETNNAIPLSKDSSSKNLEDDQSYEEDQYINRIRQRKNKRQEFKSRLIEGEQSKKQIKKKENKEPQIISKKQKCNYFQHFIDMDIEIKQSQKQTLNKTTSFPFHKKYKTQNKSLKASPQKQSIKKNVSVYTSREWQPLKAQERQLVLQPFQQTTLNLGVTTRQNSNKSIGLQASTSMATRKKLLYFKKSDKNLTKIKLNQLMSLKKLGTMTYCTSMKTMKDVKDAKENIQSKISIDSKQLISQNSLNQKKLIRIANRKVFEQLLAEQSDSTGQDIGNYRSKMKMKKEGKVRFDNIN